MHMEAAGVPLESLARCTVDNERALHISDKVIADGSEALLLAYRS